MTKPIAFLSRTISNMEEKIIDAVNTTLLEQELTLDKLLRKTNRGGNEIYIVDAFNAPNVMREIGRLREIAFREAGGGTGKELDIDRFDTMDPPCQQMIIWNPDDKMILGGYRLILGKDIKLDENGQPRIATSHMFEFTPKFINEYLPNTLELGRSFVRIESQSTRSGSRSIFVLDNLWDGIGALMVKYPEIKYLLGKVTMYPSYCKNCRNLILFFLNKYHPDPDRLVYPIKPLQTNANNDEIAKLFVGNNFKEDYLILNAEVRKEGLNIPPLVNAYMNLSPRIRVFGTAINDEFGDVEETGIFMAVDDIFEEKKMRHVQSYLDSLEEQSA